MNTHPTTTSTNNGVQSSELMELFEAELKDIYWAENALTKAIPKMIEKASSQYLVEALEKHLSETKEQIKRLEEIFRIIGKQAKAETCEAMEGLIKEAEQIMEKSKEGPMRDAGIISAAQKVEHYEIASYGTLRQFADTLELIQVSELLETTLNEEKMADTTLSRVAVSTINPEASTKEK
jgi:ferritin-like metal-binding protein YciE